MLDTTPTEAAGLVPAATVSVPAQAKSLVSGVAIVGSNPATVMAAPYGDPTWSIHVCSPDNTPFGHNKNRRELPRVDETYELHIPVCDESRPFAYVHHIATTRPIVWLRDEAALASGFFKGGRLYPEKDLKGTSKFETIKVPSGTFRQVIDKSTGKMGFAEGIEERQTEIPNNDGMFLACMFTSSIAYMLAKAISDAEQQGIKQIGLWGIMQQSDNEYAYQRPGIQYFLGEAMKRGIKIVANRESCLFDMPNWKW
jgi:hypothetical protein